MIGTAFKYTDHQRNGCKISCNQKEVWGFNAIQKQCKS